MSEKYNNGALLYSHRRGKWSVRRQALTFVAAATLWLASRWLMLQHNTCRAHPYRSTDSLLRCKIDRAQAAFHSKIARQSKTVEAARSAYRRRYGRPPPRHFDAWADFALAHNSQVIDDFDQIELDMQPFRRAGLSKAEWQRAMSRGKHAEPGEMLGTLSFIDGNVVSMGPLQGTMSTKTLEALMAPIAPFMPDMHLLFNWFAEPRILGGRGSVGDEVRFLNYSGKPTMELLQASCPQNRLVRDIEGIDLQTDVAVRDFCRQAKHSPNMPGWHGFFTAPDRFHPTTTLLPILSRAKLSVFDDILAPNVCYGHTDYRVWGENDTMAFADKQKDVYWRGSMTGISMTSTNWVHGQRHRLVRYAQSLREWKTGKKESAAGVKTMFSASFMAAPYNGRVADALTRLPDKALNIGFSGTGRGTNKTITSEVQRELPLLSRDPPKEAYKHQFVLDVDGQSMSCRLYSLLESNAVVLRQSIWAEWHDDRLIPWLHFVPIELDLTRHDIPLYMDWFINTAAGQRYAALISQHSRRWTEKALRSVDLTIYIFRILIELDDIMS